MSTSQRAADYFLNHDMNCAEALIRAANDEYDLGLDELSLRTSGGFGGGMVRGRTCGAVCGAVMALSAMYNTDRAHACPELSARVGALIDSCLVELKSIDCDALKPVWRSEKRKCAPLVERVAELLDAAVKG